MKLLALYSLATGLKVGRQFLNESLYPLPFDKYITIQNGSGMAGKNYSYYNEVLSLMRPALKAAGIEVVQLGGNDDISLIGCYHLHGKTNLHQSAYILRNSMLHIGNDSWLAHRAGAVGTPLVSLYGSTSVENHSPFSFDPSKTIFIESHRSGRRPTFALQEFPKTIDFIPPESVANAGLKLLGLPTVDRQTIYIGDMFTQPLLELVPNVILDPKISVAGALVLRMDLHHDESCMASNLQLRKCVLSVNKEVSLGLLSQLKPNLVSMRVQVDNIGGHWIKSIKKLGIPIHLVSHEQDPEKLASLRLRLYDYCLFDQFQSRTREDFFAGAKAFLNKDLDSGLNLNTLRFKTNRFLLSDGKIYLSNAHRLVGKSTQDTDHNDGNVIDTPEFWEDSGNYIIYG